MRNHEVIPVSNDVFLCCVANALTYLNSNTQRKPMANDCKRRSTSEKRSAETGTINLPIIYIKITVVQCSLNENATSVMLWRWMTNRVNKLV